MGNDASLKHVQVFVKSNRLLGNYLLWKMNIDLIELFLKKRWLNLRKYFDFGHTTKKRCQSGKFEFPALTVNNLLKLSAQVQDFFCNVTKVIIPFDIKPPSINEVLLSKSVVIAYTVYFTLDKYLVHEYNAIEYHN